MQTPNVWDFLRELVHRFGAKNPKFFTILAWIGAIVSFITGIPMLLDQLGLHIPVWEKFESKILFYCGIVMTIISNLTTQRPVDHVGTAKNTVVTEKKVLPFTAKAEKIQSQKEHHQ